MNDFRRRALALLATALSLAPSLAAWGQPNPPENGMRPSDLRTHAIIDARVVLAPGTVFDRATVIIRDGLIAAVAVDAEVPPEARRWPGEGRTVYAGLIEPALLVDAGPRPDAPGRHWNGLVHPELRIAERDVPSSADREALRRLGFTTAAVYPNYGVFRGSGALVSLGDTARDRDAIVAYGPMAAAFTRTGGWGSYPSSRMGSIALVRQTLFDAQWHAAAVRTYVTHPEGLAPPSTSPSLEALAGVVAGDQAVLFEADNELDALRAVRLAHEFELDLMLLGSGMEFRRLQEIVGLEVPIIVPLDFPDAPEAQSVHAVDNVSLRELMTWEQAPTNPRRLVEAGTVVALTTHGLENRADFSARVRRAMKQGLAFDDALAAFTTVPAALYGVSGMMGTVEPGKIANLLVMDGDLFDAEATVRTVWIAGRPHEIKEPAVHESKLAGTLRASDGVSLRVEVDPAKPSVDLVRGGEDEKRFRGRSVTLVGDQISAVIDGAAFNADGWVRLTAVLLEGEAVGNGLRDDGHRFTFQARLEPMATDAADEDGDASSEATADDDGLSGTWALLMESPGREDTVAVALELELVDEELGGVLRVFDAEAPLRDGTFDVATGTVRFAFTGPTGAMSAEGVITPGRLEGTMQGAGGAATFSGTRVDAPGGVDPDEEPAPATFVTPLGAYGLDQAPAPENVLVYNATIWTSGPQGILERADLLVEDGRIVAIGRDLAPRAANTRLIDATGKHVTPGLIDCHSHTGADGINEGGQANTAEVRIGDVLVADDIGWYRELAGGLTAANVLHGSANPIGGQNAVVKLKWGGRTTDLRIADAPEGIKFALGENVKRSENRYPDTRMGVETFIRDAFTAAAAYRDEWEQYLALPDEIRMRTIPPQRDLELDALREILAGERLVHCHSYRQDEILMLIRVADDFDFRIGTFQHVLEGYKVADAIAAHGAGASSFSDWWQYKMEVMDAIPYNGALMTEVGVNVSFNSDSGELARRMNTEASKAVRYGGVDPAAALGFVTINPARQLGVDHRIGSLEAGKDADFVIWSGDPLSTYTRCEETWIEGARYFSLEDDAVRRAAAERERARLLAKLSRRAFGSGSSTSREGRAKTPELSARTMRWLDESARVGRDAGAHTAGVCGCDDVAESVRRWREEDAR